MIYSQLKRRHFSNFKLLTSAFFNFNFKTLNYATRSESFVHI